MKRLFFVLVLVLCVFWLSGCGLTVEKSSRDRKSVRQTEAVSEREKETTEAAATEETEPVTTEATAPVETESATTEATAPVDTTEATAPVETEPVATEELDTHSAQIAQIRQWYGEIVESTDLEVTHYGASATVYRKNGKIVAITEYRQLNTDDDPSMETVHFYYHDGKPFFVFIEYYKARYEEVRLYFAGGELIRWILDKASPMDNIHSATWEVYYTDAVNAYNNMQ